MIKLELEKGIDIMKSFDYKTILKWILPILICLSSFCMVAQKTSTPINGWGIASLVFGIISVVFLFFIIIWMKKEIRS